MTFLTACVATSCETGVTMIGYPISARTRPTSSSTAVEQLGPAQLVEHPLRRRDHPAGELVVVVGRVELLRLADRQALLARELAEVLRHRGESVDVEPVREALRLEVAKRRLGGRVRRAAGQRRDRGVQHVEPGAQPLHVDERREPDRAVAVQLDRAPAGGAQEVRRELAHGRRRQQPAGILEVEAGPCPRSRRARRRARRSTRACAPR